MLYKALNIILLPQTPDLTEILIALLDRFDFEGITEEEGEIKAYIPAENFNDEITRELQTGFKDLECILKIEVEDVPEQNWNSIWESNFEPVVIGNRCVVRAPFHDEFENVEYRITIEPKMSFGTGHHQTTRLMLETILDIDLAGKCVLDMGCGTGVLGILAAMRGAGSITAIDVDKWACENTIENAGRNSIGNISILPGSVDLIPSQEFDVIFANINRNILLEQMPAYSDHLGKGGLVLISGILTDDEAVMLKRASECQFSLIRMKRLDYWTMMMFERN